MRRFRPAARFCILVTPPLLLVVTLGLLVASYTAQKPFSIPEYTHDFAYFFWAMADRRNDTVFGMHARCALPGGRRMFASALRGTVSLAIASPIERDETVQASDVHAVVFTISRYRSETLDVPVCGCSREFLTEGVIRTLRTADAVITRIAIPLWFPLAILAALTARSALPWYTRHRRRVSNQCLTCGYSLEGNITGRCPECARPVAAPRP